MRYPLIRKHLIVVPYMNKISIGTTPEVALEIQDSTGIIYEIIKLCNGENTIIDIHKLLKFDYPNVTQYDIQKVINTLESYPYIIEDGQNYEKHNLSLTTIERHSRNMNFLSNFAEKGNEKFDYLKKILNTNVLVLGLGGVGSSIVYNLAALGVKKIIGVDDDLVDRTNLNRQILYREKHINQPKYKCAQETVNEFNSQVEFIGVGTRINSSVEIYNLVDKHDIDFIICAADKPPLWIYKWVNEVSLKTKIPWIYGGNSETTSYYQTIIPGESSCYQCKERNIYEEYPEAKAKYEAILEYGFDAQNNCITASSSLLSSLMIFDFIKIITSMSSPQSLNKMTFMDYKTTELSSEKVLRNKNCECQKI